MRSKAAVWIAMAAIAATAIGCATDRPNTVVYSAVNQPPRPFVRRAPESVDVFVGRAPARPHLDVGLFEVYQGMNADGTLRSTEDMLASARLHAGLRGCDAVSIMNVELTGAYGRWRVVRGVCAVYTDEQAAQVQPNPTPPPPFPGEGQPCETQHSPYGSGDYVDLCPNPLVCQDQHCVSPYH
jgi:hypothetical protein